MLGPQALQICFWWILSILISFKNAACRVISISFLLRCLDATPSGMWNCTHLLRLSKFSSPSVVQVLNKSFTSSVEHCSGVFSHPRVTKFRGWHPWKGDNSKFENLKIYRFWQTDSLHRGNLPCWVQIQVQIIFGLGLLLHCHFNYFCRNFEKRSEKLVGQIVGQIRPWNTARISCSGNQDYGCCILLAWWSQMHVSIHQARHIHFFREGGG